MNISESERLFEKSTGLLTPHRVENLSFVDAVWFLTQIWPSHNYVWLEPDCMKSGHYTAAVIDCRTMNGIAVKERFSRTGRRWDARRQTRRREVRFREVVDTGNYTSFANTVNLVDRWGSCHKRQIPQAPTPQVPIRNRQTRKVANAKVLNRITNLT